jgi:hypothetical protein
MADKNVNIYDFEVFLGERKNFNYSILLVVNYTPYNKKLKSIFKCVEYSIISLDCLNLVLETLG